MEGFTKLHAQIITSTIWRAPDHVRLVWITMLALANKHGEVGASIPGLAAVANVSIDHCVEAISALSSKDEYSRTKDHGGRRIAEIDGGWRLLNHAKYRKLASIEDALEKDAARKRRARTKADASGGVQERPECPPIAEADSEAEAKAESSAERSPAREPATSRVSLTNPREGARAPKTLLSELLNAWDGTGGVSVSPAIRLRLAASEPLLVRLATERRSTPVAVFLEALARFRADENVRAKRLGRSVMLGELEMWCSDAPVATPGLSPADLAAERRLAARKAEDAATNARMARELRGEYDAPLVGVSSVGALIAGITPRET